MATALLTVDVGAGLMKRDAHGLTGYSSSGWERKLSWSQNLELIFSKVEPVLVSRLEGFSVPGHQNQLSAFVSAKISMICVW